MTRTWEMFAVAGVVALAVALGTVARAGDSATTVAVNADGFEVRADGFFWRDGVPHTRARVGAGGGWYRDYYGRSYYAEPTYSWFYSRAAYVKQVVAAPKLTPPPYSSDWQVEMLKYARARDDYQAYLTALNALGLQGQQYSFQQGSYGGPGLNLGAYGAGGNSLYGYSYHQVQTAYGDLNLNALYQQSARLASGAQGLAGEAFTQHSQLVGQAGENQARIMEILAKAQAARAVLEGVNPQPRVVTDTKIRGGGVLPGSGKPRDTPPADPDEAAVKDATAFLEQVGIPRCANCHSGGTLKGGFDILKYPNLSPELKQKVWGRLTTGDAEKRMPRRGKPDESTPGEPLSAADLKAFFAH